VLGIGGESESEGVVGGACPGRWRPLKGRPVTKSETVLAAQVSSFGGGRDRSHTSVWGVQLPIAVARRASSETALKLGAEFRAATNRASATKSSLWLATAVGGGGRGGGGGGSLLRQTARGSGSWHLKQKLQSPRLHSSSSGPASGLLGRVRTTTCPWPCGYGWARRVSSDAASNGSRISAAVLGYSQLRCPSSFHFGGSPAARCCAL